MTASLKMRQLESKIANLQNQYQHHLKQRQQDIAAIITSIDLASLDDNVLVGGLLFMKDKLTRQDSIAEGWRNAGDRFLRRTKSQKPKASQTLATNHAPSHPTPKQPQSREKQND